MKGEIEMTVSQDTMVQAVQMLFDVQFASGKAPTVTEIKTIDYGKTFHIKATAQEPQADEPA